MNRMHLRMVLLGLLGCDCEEIESDGKPIDTTDLCEHEATMDQSSLAILPSYAVEVSDPLQ